VLGFGKCGSVKEMVIELTRLLMEPRSGVVHDPIVQLDQLTLEADVDNASVNCQPRYTLKRRGFFWQVRVVAKESDRTRKLLNAECSCR
jgi:hypothetical protein